MSEPMYKGTRINEPPTLQGRAGQAWMIRQPAPGARFKRDHDATVAMFLLRVPGAHIAWNHWIMSVIHLRDIPGVKPAHKEFPEATHEFMIVALDPGEALPALDVTPEWRVRRLTPVDVLEQFTAADDVIAEHVLDLAVRAVVDGFLSPDQDFRSAWKQAIAGLAKDHRDGTQTVSRQ